MPEPDAVPDWPALQRWMCADGGIAAGGRRRRPVHYRVVKDRIMSEARRAIADGLLADLPERQQHLAVATMRLGPASAGRTARFPSPDDWAALLTFASWMPEADPVDVVVLHGVGTHRAVPTGTTGWRGRWPGAQEQFRSLLEGVAEDGWSKLVAWGMVPRLPRDPAAREEMLVGMTVDLMHAMALGCPCPYQVEKFEPQRGVRCAHEHRLASWFLDAQHDLESQVKWSVLSSRARRDLQAKHFVRGMFWALIVESPGAWNAPVDLTTGPRAFWACDQPECVDVGRYNYWPDVCASCRHAFDAGRHTVRIEGDQVVDRRRMVRKVFFRCECRECGNFVAHPGVPCPLDPEHTVSTRKPTMAWVSAHPLLAMGGEMPPRHGGRLGAASPSDSAEELWLARHEALDEFRAASEDDELDQNGDDDASDGNDAD